MLTMEFVSIYKTALSFNKLELNVEFIKLILFATRKDNTP